MFSKERVAALTLLLFSSLIFAIESVVIPSDGWIELGSTPNFAIQSRCGTEILLMPSATDPGAANLGGDAFMINALAVWIQNIPTSDNWWARSVNRPCVAVLENY